MRLLILISLFFLPAYTHAASLAFTLPETVRVGDTFALPLLLTAGSESVNAIEGSIHVPRALSLTAVRLDGSIVPLWVTAPESSGEDVVFAGLIPGGFEGTGTILTLLLTAREPGIAVIGYEHAKAYLNDGKGTASKLTLLPVTLSIQPKSKEALTDSLPIDTLPPEPFVGVIAQGDSFGIAGDVILFTTQDKHSGVLRYEVASAYNKYTEQSTLVWHEVHSPVPYSDYQGRYVFIRALDRAGNARIAAAVSPTTFSPIAFLATYWPLLLLLLSVILWFVFPRRSLLKNAV